MNSLTYIGIIIFVIGLFVWMFGASRLKSEQNSYSPVSPNKIKTSKMINLTGILMFVGGIVLAFIALYCC